MCNNELNPKRTIQIQQISGQICQICLHPIYVDMYIKYIWLLSLMWHTYNYHYAAHFDLIQVSCGSCITKEPWSWWSQLSTLYHWQDFATKSYFVEISRVELQMHSILKQHISALLLSFKNCWRARVEWEISLCKHCKDVYSKRKMFTVVCVWHAILH